MWKQHNSLTHSSVAGCLCCFQFEASSMQLFEFGAKSLYGHLLSLLSSEFLGGVVALEGLVQLTVRKLSGDFPKQHRSVLVSPRHCDTWYDLFFWFSCSHRCAVNYYGFNLHFPNNDDVECLFMYCFVIFVFYLVSLLITLKEIG